MKKVYLLALVIVLVLLAISISVTMAAGGRPLSTTLTGAAEVPGPGDPDGSGEAFVTLNLGLKEVCFQISVSDIAPATAAHIHEALEGKKRKGTVLFIHESVRNIFEPRQMKRKGKHIRTVPFFDVSD